MANNNSSRQKPQNTPVLGNEQIQPLLTRAEFAKALSLCTHSIQRMERRGLIKAIRINSRVIRYPVCELERLLQEATV